MEQEPKTQDQVLGKPVSRPNFAEIGITGVNRYGHWLYEEFLPDLRWPKAAKVYQEMADNDATIGAIMYMTEQLVRKASWAVIPASEDDADMETAKFIEECMHDMNASWADFICEALSMFTYGWSFHEVIYKVRRGPMERNGKYRSKFSDGKYGWRNFAPRSQHTLYGWDFAEDGNVVGMIQMAPPNFKKVNIPLGKGLLFRTKVSRGNPEGKSLLRNAYRPYYFKKRIEEIEGIGIERDLAGLPVLQPPENINIWDKFNPDSVALLAQAEALVQNIRRDSQEGVVIPPGWELKLLSTGGSRQFDTNEIINRYDQRIAITFLADIVMLGADKVGSFALADVKKSLLSTAIEAQVQSIADVINSYAVPQLININNIDCPNGYPQIRPDNIESPDMASVGTFIKDLGIVWTQDEEIYNLVRRILGVSLVTSEQFEDIKQELENQKQQEFDRQMQLKTKMGGEEDGQKQDSKNNGNKPSQPNGASEQSKK